ncbi:MAG: hypothetical protein Kow00109_19950 [Acidobacteriota bacterium]
MAETFDADLNEETQAQAEGEEKSSGWLRWILIAVGAVVVLGAGAGAAWYFGVFGGEETVEAAAAPKEKKEKKAVEVNDVVNLDPIVVNLRTGSPMKYARIGISLGLHNPEPGAQVIDPVIVGPKLKDFLVFTISQMTSDDLLKAETKQELKDAIRKFVNKELKESEAEVVEVYFTDFILQ